MINPLIAPSLFLVLRQWPQAHLGHFSIRLTSHHAVIARLDPKSGLPDFGTYQNDPVTIGRGYWIANRNRMLPISII
jgi:hypothetical protein